MPFSHRSRAKPETIEATAAGTDFQSGQLVTITFSIYEISLASDAQILHDTFQHGKEQGMYNALYKMRAVGHIAITGTISYDVGYITMTPTPNGRRIDSSPIASCASGKSGETRARNPTISALAKSIWTTTMLTSFYGEPMRFICNWLSLSEDTGAFLFVLDWRGTLGRQLTTQFPGVSFCCPEGVATSEGSRGAPLRSSAALRREQPGRGICSSFFLKVLSVFVGRPFSGEINTTENEGFSP